MSHFAIIFYGMGNTSSIHGDLSECLQTYWSKIAGKVLILGRRGDFPCEGTFLSAFNELKYRKPEHNYSVIAISDRQGNLFQQGNKIKEIKIRKDFDPANSIELLVNFQATLRLTIQGISPFSFSAGTIDLQKTLQNFDAFVDNFSKYLEQSKETQTNYAKKIKITEMSKASIRASVSQIMSSKPYEWDLVDWGNYFSLQVGMGKKNVVTLTLNSRNFAGRIAQLADALGQVEALFDTLPFPMDITMSKEFVKQ